MGIVLDGCFEYSCQVDKGQEIGRFFSLEKLDMACIGRDLIKGRVNDKPVVFYRAFGPGVVEKTIGLRRKYIKK